jgi:hypothetical protein
MKKNVYTVAQDYQGAWIVKKGNRFVRRFGTDKNAAARAAIRLNIEGDLQGEAPKIASKIIVRGL